MEPRLYKLSRNNSTRSQSIQSMVEPVGHGVLVVKQIFKTLTVKTSSGTTQKLSQKYILMECKLKHFNNNNSFFFVRNTMEHWCWYV